MTRFEQTAYLKKPGQSEDVIIFGKGEDQEAEDLENGVARLGGPWRTPSYLGAYVRSAAMLVSTATQSRELDDVGLPIFYLQRHATELCIKRLLSWIYEIAEFREKAGKPCNVVPTGGQRNRFHGHHGLGFLLQDLREVATSFGFQPPPLQLSELVDQLLEFEKTPTWSRYDKSLTKGVIVRHVEDEVTLPVVRIQQLLEEVVRIVLMRPNGEDTAYESELYDEWYVHAVSDGKCP